MESVTINKQLYSYSCITCSILTTSFVNSCNNTMKQLFLYLTLLFFTATAFSQKEQYSIFYYNFEIYKTLKTNEYIIKEARTLEEQLRILDNKRVKKQKVVKKGIKMLGYLGTTLQVLDKNNKILYLDKNLQSIPYPEPYDYGVSGTVAHYYYAIEENPDYYMIRKTTDNTILPGEVGTTTIDSISKKGITDIYFFNKERKLALINNDCYYPTLVIFEKDSKFGILDNQKILTYDNLEVIDNNIKVRQNGLYGYYGLTEECRYSKLGKYEFNLARFETPKGKSGYIDLTGNEYYD